ncbi:DUF5808 domain-containing protein [Neobacillus niacini]|uniref:DUF1648 domain-containing protein n=1 Tax=Neobacillus niacini TaxID=86668 RepID=UPI00052FA1CC|nr:DUF5808 domain-containing protein [Neobacillus niacini]KGM44707.1 hypothetical protein NP83_10050 [Neobacillus niacini]MEC1525368.1 DUF5808 domain-containing protein [Neobacillus niacini]
MTLAIFLFISIILAGIQTAIPFLVKRTIIFGITVPEKHIKNEQLLSYKKNYTFIVALVSVIALASYVLWVLVSNPVEEKTVLIGTFIQFGIILFSLSLYFYYHGKTLQLKKKQNWMEQLKQVKVADLSVRSQDEMLSWYVFLLPIVMTVGVIVYTIFQYDLLPNQIPTHWGANGKADRFTEKTPISAISLPLTLLAMQVMFLGINIGKSKSGIQLSATSLNASRNRQLTLRKNSSWLMFGVSFLLTIMFSFFQLTTIHPDLFAGTAMMAAPIIFLVILLTGTIIFAVKVGRADKQSVGEQKEDITDYDEDSYWKGGLFYFNRNDPSIFVEKRFGVGWTLNFGNPIGYIIVFVPLVVIIILSNL